MFLSPFTRRRRLNSLLKRLNSLLKRLNNPPKRLNNLLKRLNNLLKRLNNLLKRLNNLLKRQWTPFRKNPPPKPNHNPKNLRNPLTSNKASSLRP